MAFGLRAVKQPLVLMAILLEGITEGIIMKANDKAKGLPTTKGCSAPAIPLVPVARESRIPSSTFSRTVLTNACSGEAVNSQGHKGFCVSLADDTREVTQELLSLGLDVISLGL